MIQCGEKSSVKGTVKIAVEVSAEGNVTGASVAETPDAALGACVVAAVKKATFPTTQNGGSFRYPFKF